MAIRVFQLDVGLLALSLCSGALASPFSQQQYLISDSYPYGHSPADFRRATSRPTVEDSFAITGYDIAAGNGSATATTKDFGLEGWRLAVSVTSDVPIPSGNPDSRGGSKVFDAALLSLTPPTKLAEALERDAPSIQDWSVCTAVWTLGLSESALARAASSTGPEGSCSTILPPDCIAEMQAGFDSAGFCQNQTMPLSCAPYFLNGTDGVTRASNLPQSKHLLGPCQEEKE